MKPDNFTFSDHGLENHIDKKHSELKDRAAKYGEHFGRKNLPKSGRDNFAPYIGQLKHGYEELSAYSHQKLQPDAHLPKATMKVERAKERDKHYDSQIAEKNNNIGSDIFRLGDYHPKYFLSRLLIALIATGIIFIGDISLNIRAFEFMGGSYLRALLVAVSCSMALFLLSHATPLIYKSCKTKSQRILVIASSLLLALGISTAFAVLRSLMYSTQNTFISPLWFVIVNMFLFIIGTIVSFFFMPTWDELKEHLHNLGKWMRIKKEEKQVENLKKIKEANKDEALNDSIEHYQAVIYAKHIDERIKRMYREAVQIFVNTNLIFRNDAQVPECFNSMPDDPDLSFAPTSNNYPNKILP